MAETQRVAIVTGAAGGGIGRAMVGACWGPASGSPVSIEIVGR